MYVRRNIKWNVVFRFAWKNLIIFTVWSTIVVVAYNYAASLGITIGIPFLPVGTIGTAVAFYIGFKNSQSYDRFWEGRKIWGGIVNYSRTWANQVLTYVADHTTKGATDAEGIKAIRQQLIYRHISWINALRIQLRRTTIFDRNNLTHVPDFKLVNDRDCIKHISTFFGGKRIPGGY